jgi:hypothetical protein
LADDEDFHGRQGRARQAGGEARSTDARLAMPDAGHDDPKMDTIVREPDHAATITL